VYVHIPKKLKKKLDSKSLKVVFVVYCTHSKAYHFWDTKHRWIIVSRDVIFDKSSMVDDITMSESSYGLLYNLGIFTIKVPFFDHKTQGLCLCYFSNIESKWNKFK
jgi:hypothetical protein